MRRRRLSIVCALLICYPCAGSMPARADAATKRQKIAELFTLMQVDKTLQQAATQQITQVQSLMKIMVPGMKMTADEQKDFDSFLHKLVGITQGALSWPKLEPQFVDLYASTYSEEEIDGIVAFYRTPPGAAMIAKQPALLSKSQAIAQTQLLAVQPEIRAAVMQFVQEMAAKRQKN